MATEACKSHCLLCGMLSYDIISDELNQQVLWFNNPSREVAAIEKKKSPRETHNGCVHGCASVCMLRNKTGIIQCGGRRGKQGVLLASAVA